MKVIKYENVVACDIDDTILMWDSPTVSGPGKLGIAFAGSTVYLTPHHYHVDLLKMYNERGYYIIFWSANGWQHAERAVQALGLEYLADGTNGHIQAKLSKFIDDNPNAESILGARVYCKDLTKPTYYLLPKIDPLTPIGGGSRY
jgi:hydroxymethylpyrimidine pyrophosphatase-like HAD family hydrolase